MIGVEMMKKMNDMLKVKEHIIRTFTAATF